jgi:uncharacterized repeat protein (TIGR02543 family)
MVSQIGLKMTSYTGKMIYGFLVDTVMSDGRWTYRLFNYSGKIYYDVGNDNTRLIGSNNSFQNNTYYDFEVGNFYVKNLSTNTTLLTGSPVSSFSWDPQNYYMCVFNDGRTTPASGEVYYLKIYDNDELVGNFIPAKRNSDNVLGMYDTVTGVFKTNAGTGIFTAGPVANVSTYTVGVGTTLDTVPTRNGYTFAGWCTDAQLQNCAMTQTISASDTGDKTFYAKWIQSYTCNAGYYLPMNANACTICPANSYCAGGTYEFSSTVPQGVVSCATGLLSPTGMWEVAQCGRRLHFGDNVIYLRATKKTVHAMNFDLDHDGVADYFANMTTIDTPAHAGTNRRLKVYFGGQVYFVYDDTVNPGQ